MSEFWAHKVLEQFKDGEALAARYMAAGEDVPSELQIVINELWAEIVRLGIEELV